MYNPAPKFEVLNAYKRNENKSLHFQKFRVLGSCSGRSWKTLDYHVLFIVQKNISPLKDALISKRHIKTHNLGTICTVAVLSSI